MSIKQLRLGKGLLMMLLCCCVWDCCAGRDAQGREDFIGPKGSEPNRIPATVAQAKAVQAPASGGPLNITIGQATLLALENNRSLIVQRFDPQISRTYVQEGLSVFDPVLTGELAFERDKTTDGSTVTERDGVSAGIGIQEFLPTGTTLGLTGSVAPNAMTGLLSEDEYVSRLAFNATQSLLRGLGPAVNRAAVNQAKIDVKISQYELRGFAQALVAQTEETYWDYVAAERRIAIFTQSLDLAQRQLEETRERIRLGDVAPTELSAAEAEVALRREALINARSTLAKTRQIGRAHV
jgi:outer membrane protein TolC